jgi:tripartite-type tricarboxylate transporter receptor subunit TctC
VTPAKRLAALPDVPALGEFVPGYEAFGWYGLGAPRKTPTEVVNKLSDATKAALGDPKSQASFVELGIESMPFSPDEFETPPSVAARIEFWRGLHERLAQLSNRLDAETRGKVMVAVHARVPMVTPEEQRAS